MITPFGGGNKLGHMMAAVRDKRHTIIVKCHTDTFSFKILRLIYFVRFSFQFSYVVTA